MLQNGNSGMEREYSGKVYFAVLIICRRWMGLGKFELFSPSRMKFKVSYEMQMNMNIAEYNSIM